MSDRDERIEYLVERHTVGALDAADLAELRELLADPEAARAFVEALADNHEWRTWAGREGSPENFLEAVLERRRSTDDGDSFVRAVTDRARRKAPSRVMARLRRGRPESGSRFLLAGAIAAGVFLALLLVLMVGGETPPRPVGKKVAPKEEQVPVPAPKRIELPPPVPKEPPRDVPAPVPQPEPFVPPPAPPVTPKAPESVPVPAPPAPKVAPPPEKPQRSEVEAAPAVARIEKAYGSVTGGPGHELRAGDSLGVGRESAAWVKYPDGTRLEIVADTEAGPFAAKGLTLTRGVLTADVARQPANAPFVISTPHAEATVLGTAFTVAVTAAWTRLEVREGRVRLSRSGGSVDVRAGYFAVAAPGLDLTARQLYARVPGPGLRLWLRADTGVLAPDRGVTQWGDQSGNQMHATQTAPARQPALVHNVVNGRPAVRLDGVDDALSLPPGFNDFRAGLTAFVVARASRSVPWARFLDLGNGTQSNNIVFGQKDVSLLLTYWVYSPDTTRGKVDAPGAIVLDAFHAYGVTETGTGNVTVFRNGAPLGTGSTSVPRNVLRTANAIGTSGGVTADPYFKGEIAEVLLYNRPLSEGERLSVEEYLNAKYFSTVPGTVRGTGK